MKNIFTTPLGMFFPKKMLGVDISTSSLKVVEVSRWGGQKTLENYGQIASEVLSKDSPSSTSGNGRPAPLLSNDATAHAIKAILQEAGIKTKAVIFSIPDFSTFCTSFDIPSMTPKELPDAIRYNASQYIPLPIAEVTLDWHIMAKTPGDKKSSSKVFLVAVPNQVIQEYKNMAKIAGLQLHALEAEALGMVRALVKNKKKVICLVDIGIQTSTINIIDNGFLKSSYSFNFNSGQLSRVVASTLGVDATKAEEIKNKEGLLYQRQDVVKTLYLLIDPLLIEIKSICAEFLQAEKRPVEDIYLTGGTANLPGLREYFTESLKKNVSVPNCFLDFLYPPILEETLEQMSPSFSAALGVALGGIEG